MHFLTESFRSQISFRILLRSQNCLESECHRPTFLVIPQLMLCLYHGLFQLPEMNHVIVFLLLLLILQANALIPVQSLQHLLCGSSTVRPSLVLRCQINSYIFSCLCTPFAFEMLCFFCTISSLYIIYSQSTKKASIESTILALLWNILYWIFELF